ncbi:putative Tacrolimus-binding protein [Clavispora lusitaniae]|uniref:peptidylprolyl isomerase n=1 Tax=Clavispora lusitaniae TaxID=36911 RepID=A0AA91SZK1_CLALS|nr:putative Tacrolimus-binding protein [Clavispora lusitaniae]
MLKVIQISTLLCFLISAAFAANVKIDVLEKVSDCKVKAKNGNTVSVHYSGYLTDGTQFDSSYNRGSPISFTLGSGQVIQGWEQGIHNMCVGEKRKLTIPPSLGYGNRNVGPIPANSELIFDVELMDVQAPYKEEL